MRLTRWLVGIPVALSLIGAAFAPTAQAAEVDLRANLTGSASFTTARGVSEYDRTATERDVEVTVRNIVGLAGERVGVFVSGEKVGTILVSSAGLAHREWDTEHGQSVPFASAGDFIKIRTATGVLVASGKYFREADDVSVTHQVG